MATQPADTPDRLQTVAKSLQAQQESQTLLRTQCELALAEAARQQALANDRLQQMLKEARRNDLQLQEILVDEKAAKQLPAYTQAAESLKQAKQETGLDDLAAAKKERRQQIEADVKADPQLQELESQAQEKQAEAATLQAELDQSTHQLAQASREFIDRVAGMQPTLF